MSANATEAGVWDLIESPIGPLTVLLAASGALVSLRFPDSPPPPAADRRRLDAVAGQLGEYFEGRRRRFELDLELDGSDFQLAVWRRLREIPYGETVSYGQLAAEIDEAVFPGGLEPHERARAVGSEVGRTPIPIVIPCHRVVGADGSLTGYGGGLERKRALLELESCQLALL